MGQHGIYIWASYGLVFVSLGWFALKSLDLSKRIKQQLHRNCNKPCK